MPQHRPSAPAQRSHHDIAQEIPQADRFFPESLTSRSLSRRLYTKPCARGYSRSTRSMNAHKDPVPPVLGSIHSQHLNGSPDCSTIETRRESASPGSRDVSRIPSSPPPHDEVPNAPRKCRHAVIRSSSACFFSVAPADQGSNAYSLNIGKHRGTELFLDQPVNGLPDLHPIRLGQFFVEKGDLPARTLNRFQSESRVDLLHHQVGPLRSGIRRSPLNTDRDQPVSTILAHRTYLVAEKLHSVFQTRLLAACPPLNGRWIPAL